MQPTNCVLAELLFRLNSQFRRNGKKRLHIGLEECLRALVCEATIFVNKVWLERDVSLTADHQTTEDCGNLA